MASWWQVDLPSFQASAVFLLPHDDLLGWALLVLHLSNFITSASHLLPNHYFYIRFPSDKNEMLVQVCLAPSLSRWREIKE